MWLSTWFQFLHNLFSVAALTGKAVLAMLQSISIIAASGAAVYGVLAWRKQHVGRRRIDLAEEVLALFYEAPGIIQTIRNPWGPPTEGSSALNSDGTAKKEIYQSDISSERYAKHSDTFAKLYALRYRFMACFGASEGEPFERLQAVVNRIMFAAFEQSCHMKKLAQQSSLAAEPTKERTEHVMELNKIIWYVSEEDDISKEVDRIVSDVEAICRPYLSQVL